MCRPKLGLYCNQLERVVDHRSAPRDLVSPKFAVLQTPVASASKCLTSCTAEVPTAPEAPYTSTPWPLRILPLLRKCKANMPP